MLLASSFFIIGCVMARPPRDHPLCRAVMRTVGVKESPRSEVLSVEHPRLSSLHGILPAINYSVTVKLAEEMDSLVIVSHGKDGDSLGMFLGSTWEPCRGMPSSAVHPGGLVQGLVLQWVLPVARHERAFVTFRLEGIRRKDGRHYSSAISLPILSGKRSAARRSSSRWKLSHSRWRMGPSCPPFPLMAFMPPMTSHAIHAPHDLPVVHASHVPPCSRSTS
ncbi:unnamed protein product [Darwinula stevensoni]|uniref:Reelin domain-containing protein n=1 Tax=Darwinula stevensoni TaxID=69355 RepID=A0A7R9AHA0_9CRUS|nr:unnamed protein product [Darwinula stevensoni]CAG0904478.1 unnamed protein product [Darwinula stevensoni]